MTETSQKSADAAIQSTQNSAGERDGGEAVTATLSPRRIQLKRTKGWRMPENTVKVDRTNKTFGNIFTIGCNPSHFSAALPTSCNSAADAVSCFRYYADTWMALTQGRWIKPLKGKNLACWCALNTVCHADVLLELANKEPTP